MLQRVSFALLCPECRTPDRPRRRRESDGRRHSPSPQSRSTSAKTTRQLPSDIEGPLRSPIVFYAHPHHSSEDSKSDDSRSPSPSPSPPPLPPILRRRPSISMPGSLFPRSPSLVPDNHSGNNDDRHVHFTPQPARLQDQVPDAEENAPGPSRCPPRSTSSVKAAVDRFNTGGRDADPSILLPVPHTSPTRVGKAIQDKGKSRAIEVWDDPEDGDTLGEVRVRGKERELVAAREEQRMHESQRQNEAEAKEAEEGEEERARDKERIRMLEGEIARLKQEVGIFLPAIFRLAELAIQLLRRPTPASLQYPPPPPPPPPPPIRVGSTAGTGQALFSTARAALKHAPPPVEAPINPLPPSRRQGQPTVGIAPDMMASFLKEMKTVRLRKVSGSMPLPTGPSSNNMEGSTLQRRGSLPALRKVGGESSTSSLSVSLNGKRRDNPEAHAGEKRKRGDERDLEDFRDDLRVLFCCHCMKQLLTFVSYLKVRRSNSALLLLHPLILVSPQHLPPPLSHSLNRNHSPIRFPPHSAEHSPRLHSQMVPLPRSALTMRLTGKMKGFLPRRLCLDRHLGTCSDSRKLGSQWKRIPHVLDLKNRRSLTSTC